MMLITLWFLYYIKDDEKEFLGAFKSESDAKEYLKFCLEHCYYFRPLETKTIPYDKEITYYNKEDGLTIFKWEETQVCVKK